jgi:hypothetical protein
MACSSGASQNREINERLKTLIAAYKTLGGSCTGELAVDPSHRRDLRGRTSGPAAPDDPSRPVGADSAPAGDDPAEDAAAAEMPGAERRRRVRDAVEAALSDVILLGTEAQVRLATRAANEMVAGRSVAIVELVVSLRTCVLDLEPIPAGLAIPKQAPRRIGMSASRGAGARGGAFVGCGAGLAGIGLQRGSGGDGDDAGDHATPP